jgi:hypothetical protein
MEQPTTEHMFQPSNTPSDDPTKFPTITSPDAPEDYSHSTHFQQSPMPMMDEYHHILRDPQINKTISPGGMMDLRMRPPSPTNLCDFPYYDFQGDEFLHQHMSLPLSFNTTTRLPRIKVNRADLKETTL